jgi:hypothetical protein
LQSISLSLAYNATSGLWEGSEVLSELAEAGLWTVDFVYCRDGSDNEIFYYYDVDYVANFTVTSPPSSGGAPVIPVIPSSPEPEEDTEAPVLWDLWVDPSVIDAGENVTVYANVTDASEVASVCVNVTAPSGPLWLSCASLVYNQSSSLWETVLTIPDNSEDGTWSIPQLLAADDANNQKCYNYGVDFTVNFNVTAPVVINALWVSDEAGNVIVSSFLGDNVYATVNKTGQTVSFYLTNSQQTWNDGDPLTDMSTDGVETVTLESGEGTQTLLICENLNSQGTYNVVMDVDSNGIFDANVDLFDVLEVDAPDVVPEFSSNIMLLVSLVSVGAFVMLMRFRQKSQTDKN